MVALTAATQIAAYVDITANGDESKILSAGLSVRAARGPQTVLAALQNLSVTSGDNAGALDVHWDALGNAKSYEVQTSPDPFTNTSWTTADTVTNSKGKGAWSDVATKIVP